MNVLEQLKTGTEDLHRRIEAVVPLMRPRLTLAETSVRQSSNDPFGLRRASRTGALTTSFEGSPAQLTVCLYSGRNHSTRSVQVAGYWFSAVKLPQNLARA